MNKSDTKITKPFVVAVTGGIASGKTSVCELFQELFKIETIDTDILAKEAVSSGSNCLNEIVSVFGERVIDETRNLNRQLMRKIIFKNSNLRKKLESIVHPEVRRLIDSNLSRINSKYCLLGIPLLHQKNQDARIDRVLVVDCEEQLQIQRATVRDNLERKDIERIISSQATREKRLGLADDVITNQGTLNELKDRIVELHELYCDLSTQK